MIRGSLSSQGMKDKNNSESFNSPATVKFSNYFEKVFTKPRKNSDNS